MRALNKSVVFILVYALGVMTARYIPLSFEKKAETDQPMVEKVGDDSLKISSDALKSLKISKVTFGNVPERLSVMGKISVAEDRTSIVAARVAGRIDAVSAPSGVIVKPGAMLASLFSPDYVIAREEYLQTLTELKTSSDPEEKKLLGLSVQKLLSMGVSRYDIDHIGESDKSSHLIVRAPRGGAVISKTATIGNPVNPGDMLFTIGDTTSVWFAGDLYPTDLEKVHLGQQVFIDPDNGGQPIEGKVSFISPMIDATSRTIKLRAQMTNASNALRLDMYVRGNIILSNRPALTIPKGALVRDGNTFVCFKQLPNNLFKRVQIETSGDSGDSVIISKGLTENDQVVSEGTLLLVSALSMSDAQPE